MAETPVQHSPISPAYAAQDRGPVTVATMCTVTAVGTAFVVARCYVRPRIMRKVFYDDYLIVFSLVRLHVIHYSNLAAFKIDTDEINTALWLGSSCIQDNSHQVWWRSAHGDPHKRADPRHHPMDNSWLLAWNSILRYSQDNRRRSPNPHLESWESTPRLPLDVYPSMLR
jgi:hypothetical protein